MFHNGIQCCLLHLYMQSLQFAETNELHLVEYYGCVLAQRTVKDAKIMPAQLVRRIMTKCIHCANMLYVARIVLRLSFHQVLTRDVFDFKFPLRLSTCQKVVYSMATKPYYRHHSTAKDGLTYIVTVIVFYWKQQCKGSVSLSISNCPVTIITLLSFVQYGREPWKIALSV